MNYDDLLIEADKEEIEIYENSYIGRLGGLYLDGTITINTNLETDIERLCVLAEELGHYYTTSGDILDQSKIENRKQEHKARAWGYEKVVPIHRLVDGYLAGMQNRYELSEFLGVTEQYLIEAVEYYYNKFGAYISYGEYFIYFNPLAISKGIENEKRKG